MERKEMIEILMGKAHISHKEAEEALEKCDWDLLDAIFYLERMGKFENKNTTTIIEVKEKDDSKKEKNKKHEEKCGGFGEVIGRMFKFIGKVIKKGNENYFEIRKENEKTIKIPVTISILLLVFLFWPVAALLVIGLFCGYKYSISGPNVKCDGVNDVLEKVSESADNIKKDFKEGYQK
ncbi:DUF4342 domain-containing protein [Clostridium sp. AL.422]|uniref:DUF4342 domain-containing protein n=1 Tax=Clostridium TaxID=1485 RepID=UPI00293DF4BD|nr:MULTISPECIES: DUF4342 domain-containing protein [unclassified Clostridium]MDV4149599.1 DUF4342 domain-containing protein [Clostridium sp. AL.422]